MKNLEFIYGAILDFAVMDQDQSIDIPSIATGVCSKTYPDFPRSEVIQLALELVSKYILENKPAWHSVTFAIAPDSPGFGALRELVPVSRFR